MILRVSAGRELHDSPKPTHSPISDYDTQHAFGSRDISTHGRIGTLPHFLFVPTGRVH